jgi:hypothetical protein
MEDFAFPHIINVYHATKTPCKAISCSLVVQGPAKPPSGPIELAIYGGCRVHILPDYLLQRVTSPGEPLHRPSLGLSGGPSHSPLTVPKSSSRSMTIFGQVFTCAKRWHCMPERAQRTNLETFDTHNPGVDSSRLARYTLLSIIIHQL